MNTHIILYFIHGFFVGEWTYGILLIICEVDLLYCSEWHIITIDKSNPSLIYDANFNKKSHTSNLFQNLQNK